jgi:D-alanyl-D-alanine carboxypeptidase
MPDQPIRTTISRRGLLHLTALSLSGLAAACGRGNAPREATAPTPGASASPAAKGTAGSATPPASETGVARGEPVCLITKQTGLPASYVPPDLVTLPARVSAGANIRLRQPAADALLRLIEGAADQGYTLFALSGFRSYDEQDVVLRNEIATQGREVAEKQVAPPGHSEHQLGLAVDVTPKSSPYELREAFGQEPEGRWLTANAARFGFVISYPREKEAATGYTYEPWHIRYVGTPLAEQVVASGLSLTEFLPKHNLAGGCPI